MKTFPIVYLRLLFCSFLFMLFCTFSPKSTTASMPQTQSLDINGSWSIDANGTKGSLSIKQNGNSFSGAILGNSLINGVVSGNTIKFVRDIGLRQEYSGTVSTEPDGSMKMQGTFSQKGSNTVYYWSATKPRSTTNVTTQPHQKPKPPIAPTASDSKKLQHIDGEWSVIANNHKGELLIRLNGTSFTGKILNTPVINGLVDGSKIQFTRDIGARQEYTGILTTETDGTMKITGTFTQKGSNTVFKWSATKASSGRVLAKDETFYNYLGIPVHCKTGTQVTFHPNNMIKSATLSRQSTFHNYRKQEVTIAAGQTVSFYSNGYVQYATTMREATYQAFRDKNVIALQNSMVVFSQSGYVLSAIVARESTFQNYLGQDIVVNKGTKVSFFQNGFVEYATTKREANYTNFKKQNVPVTANTQVTFYPNGFVKKATIRQSATYTNKSNQSVNVPAGSTITFTETGVYLSTNKN